MSMVGSSGTKPELALAMELTKEDVLFIYDPLMTRKQRAKIALPGKPDLFHIRAKLAVFVHGCFWHGCPKHYRRPDSNRSFWDNKLKNNQKRDMRVRRKLRKMGWRTVVVWECDTRKRRLAAAVRRVQRMVVSQGL